MRFRRGIFLAAVILATLVAIALSVNATGPALAKEYGAASWEARTVLTGPFVPMRGTWVYRLTMPDGSHVWVRDLFGRTAYEEKPAGVYRRLP